MRTAFVSAAALTAVLAVVPASAEEPLLLAGTTTIVAPGGSAHMPVRVPATVTLPSGYLDPSYVSVTGTADVVVVYLVPARPRPLLQEPVTFGRVRVGTSRHTMAGFPNGVSTIAAGDYDLVVLHTAGTATVQLRLPGLRGSTTLRVEGLSPARIAPLGADPGVVGASGGVYGTLPGRGFVNVAGFVRTDLQGGVTRLTTCFKRPGDGVAEEVDFGSGCPGLQTVSFVVTQGKVSFGQAVFLNHGPGRYGGGYTYEMAGLSSASAGFVAWVPTG